MTRTSYNPARFDVLSLHLVVACARTGSLTAAARECHLALAAASRRLRELEDALGGALFERTARGVVATVAGGVLIRHARDMLLSLDRAGTELADLRDARVRHVRLCASTAAITQYLPPLIADYGRRAPRVRIDLEEQTSDAVVRALREGQADVGVFVDGSDRSGLRCRAFRDDELVLVYPRGHPLQGTSAVALAEALDEDWISLGTGAALWQQLQAAAFAANRPLKLRVQVRSFDAVCHLVAAKLGVALLPKAAVLPIAKVLAIGWRPLADRWARRSMLVATTPGADSEALGFARFLARPSPSAKAVPRRRQ